MKICSINLHCHKELDEDLKLGKLAKYILKNDIDVVLLQEVCQLLEGNYVLKNLKQDNNGYILSKLTGYNYEFKGFKIGFGIYEEGLGILSKKPISDLKMINLTNTLSFNDWKRRCAIYFKQDNINFVDVHLGWSLSDEKIETQIDKLMSICDESTVLAGDFNYPDNTEPILRIKKNLKSCADIMNINPKDNPTFHYELDSKIIADNKMIDYFFVGNNILVKDYKIEFKEEQDYISDHSLLYIEIE